MDWYFATNEASLTNRRDDWRNMILVAVRSAAANTTLVPHMIYDGGDNPFVARLERLGVRIIRHRSRLYDFIAACARIQNNTDRGYMQIATSAFLRVDIPALVDAPFVLYTDCDVMFRSDPRLDHLRPEFFACAPETQRGVYDDMNAGVMLMNVGNLKKRQAEFEKFIRFNFDRLDTYDQAAYRMFFKDQYVLMSDDNNWKPYWGISRDAAIVHFHGPKPAIARKIAADADYRTHDIYHALYDRNPAAYAHYVAEWRGHLPVVHAWRDVVKSGLSAVARRLRR